MPRTIAKPCCGRFPASVIVAIVVTCISTAAARGAGPAATDTTRIRPGGPPLTDLAFAPDGRTLLAISQNGIERFDWPELRRQRRIETSAPNLYRITFAPGGKRLAVAGGYPAEGGTVEIFSWPDLQSLAQLEAWRDSVRAVEWIDDQQIVGGGVDRSLIQYAMVNNQWQQVATQLGHSRAVSALTLLPRHPFIVSASEDHSLRVWKLDSNQVGELHQSLKQHTLPVRALALRQAKPGLPMIASASADRSIRFWQPTIGRMVRFVRLDSEPLCIAWSNDGNRIVAGCIDGCIRVVDAMQVSVTQTVPAVKGWAYAIAVHPEDGSVVVGGSDGQLKKFDMLEASVRRDAKSD